MKRDFIHGQDFNFDLNRVVKGLDELAPVHFIVGVESDEEVSSVISKLQRMAPALLTHRCLFYSTTIGKVAIIRQLNPSLHIESDVEFCDKIKAHIKKIILVDQSAVAFTRTSPASSESSSATNSTREGCGTGVLLNNNNSNTCGSNGTHSENISGTAVCADKRQPQVFVGGIPAMGSFGDILNFHAPK